MTGPRPVVAFRVDASVEIGTGHAMRCLTLAGALARRGLDCHFLCRDLPGHFAGAIAAAGQACHLLPAPGAGGGTDGTTAHSAWLGVTQATDAAECAPILSRLSPAWVIVDHYALDRRWEEVAVPPGAGLMVLDDLADRPHCADLLLDQNLGRRAADYDALLPAACRRLIGPGFALLRSEFAAHRAESLGRRRDGRIARILVALGGVDRENVTTRVLDALAAGGLPGEVSVTVVLGAAAPWKTAVAERCANLPFPAELRVAVADMAGVMAGADLAIGAGGSSSWERCCLGLPTLLVVLADNQREAAAALAAAGAARIVDPALPIAVPAPCDLAAMAARSAEIVDGLGTDRVAAIVALGNFQVRNAAPNDAEFIYACRYHGVDPSVYLNRDVPDLEAHVRWIASAISNPERRLLIISFQGEDIGHVRLDRHPADPKAMIVSICLNPRQRKRGRSAPVLLRALLEASFDGVERFEAVVHLDNPASHRLFESLGFQRTGTADAFLVYSVISDDLVRTPWPSTHLRRTT